MENRSQKRIFGLVGFHGNINQNTFKRLVTQQTHLLWTLQIGHRWAPGLGLLQYFLSLFVAWSLWTAPNLVKSRQDGISEVGPGLLVDGRIYTLCMHWSPGHYALGEERLLLARVFRGCALTCAQKVLPGCCLQMTSLLGAANQGALQVSQQGSGRMDGHGRAQERAGHVGAVFHKVTKAEQ